LVDEGESVALRLFDAAERAEAETRRGLRRLFVLRESRRLKQQVRALPQVEKWQVLTTGLPAGGPVERQWIDLLAERGLFREAAGVAVGPNTPVGPVPRTATEWQRCVARGVEQLGLAAQDVTELLGPLVQTAHEARKQIDRLGVMPPVQGAKADARQQWGDLLRPGFWTDAPWFWLRQYPRYLRGISLRIDKLLAGGLARDQRGQQQVAGWQARYQERAQRHQERGLNDLALSEFRWLLEEYRISLFCQELRTVVPVSERRLEESWSRVIE
jgi:ATP-dependent helicase HrpA